MSLSELNNALANAIVGTSTKANAIATIDTPFADPDAETLRLKFNDLVLNGRR